MSLGRRVDGHPPPETSDCARRWVGGRPTRASRWEVLHASKNSSTVTAIRTPRSTRSPSTWPPRAVPEDLAANLPASCDSATCKNDPFTLFASTSQHASCSHRLRTVTSCGLRGAEQPEACRWAFVHWPRPQEHRPPLPPPPPDHLNPRRHQRVDLPLPKHPRWRVGRRGKVPLAPRARGRHPEGSQDHPRNRNVRSDAAAMVSAGSHRFPDVTLSTMGASDRRTAPRRCEAIISSDEVAIPSACPLAPPCHRSTNHIRNSTRKCGTETEQTADHAFSDPRWARDLRNPFHVDAVARRHSRGQSVAAKDTYFLSSRSSSTRSTPRNTLVLPLADTSPQQLADSVRCRRHCARCRTQEADRSTRHRWLTALFPSH